MTQLKAQIIFMMRFPLSLFVSVRRTCFASALTVFLIPLPAFGGDKVAKSYCENRYGFMPYDDEICKRSSKEREGFRGLQDDLKFIPVADDVLLTIGGQVRQRYEYTANQGFGESLQGGDGAWLQRVTLHGDLRVGEHFRVFAEGFHTYQLGREDGSGPLDENLFEFQNAFVEATVQLGDSGTSTLSARIGRQELALGSGRLLSVREGPNNRLNFDVARLTLDIPDWKIDGIVARPVAQKMGVLDDEFGDTRWLWGVYATGGHNIFPASSVDVYYLGFHDDFGNYVQGTGTEERHSIGTRIFGSSGIMDWNWEGIYQFGDFSGGDIQAWMVDTDTGFTLADAPGSPRIGLTVGLSTGDEDSSDEDLGTFNALYERADYFSEASVLGTRNYFSVKPSIGIAPAERWTASVTSSFTWRLETDDGVYGPAGFLLRAPSSSNEKFIGNGVSLNTNYEITNGLNASVNYTHIFTGDFIRDTGAGEDIDLLDVTLQFKF